MTLHAITPSELSKVEEPLYSLCGLNLFENDDEHYWDYFEDVDCEACLLLRAANPDLFVVSFREAFK